MKENNILSIIIVFLLLGVILIPFVEGQNDATSGILNYSQKMVERTHFNGNSFNSQNIKNNCTPQDEGDHFPCGWETWCYHASLTLENGQQWDAAVIFVYFMNRTRKEGFTEGISYWRFRHWNRQTGKFYDDFHSDVFPGVLQTEKNKVNATYKYNYFRGLYPDYNVYSEDRTNNITTNLTLHAISKPCWLYQESTNGVLPWGMSGTGEAYFVPMLEVTGNISINGSYYNLTGYAYYEHDIGYFDFAKPYVCYSLKEMINSTKAMLDRKLWWRNQVIKNRHEKLYQLHLSNDYLFGWNWGWVKFDNGWSIVIFTPTNSFQRDGLLPSFLYFTKDGEKYYEIGCVYWKHVNEKYIERADIYIPVDFEVTAYRDDIEFHLVFNATTEITELYSKDFASYSKQEGGTFFACGVVKGRYKDKEDDLNLQGTYCLDQTRWLPKGVKHLSLDIDLFFPPKGLGFDIRKVSHRFGFENFFKIQFIPKFEFIFHVKPTYKPDH